MDTLLLDPTALDLLKEIRTGIAALAAPAGVGGSNNYHIGKIACTAALTNTEIRIPATKYLAVISWPFNVGSLTIRIGEINAPPIEVLTMGDVIKTVTPFTSIFVSTDAGAVGGEIVFAIGKVSIESLKNYGAGGIAPAGNGLYPTWVMDVGGGEMPDNTVWHEVVAVAGSTLISSGGNLKGLFIQNNSTTTDFWCKYDGTAAVAGEGVCIRKNGGAKELTPENGCQQDVYAIEDAGGADDIHVTRLT